MRESPQRVDDGARRHVYLRERMGRYADVVDVVVGWPLAVIHWTRDLLWALGRLLKAIVD